jgi:glycolate oxidase FAD binding subunit
MNAPLQPASIEEMAAAVGSHAKVLAIGAGTKPRLSRTHPEVTRLSTTRLAGVSEYHPGEYVITALAGTRIAELKAVLAASGQHLPWDPPLARAGATLGGAIAAGLNGPGRFRFGGARDFILGVRFIDGAGRVLRLGGRVVKNAAGFDLPKFMVGSLGRFGVIAEATFKVFPAPEARLTVALKASSPAEMRTIFSEAAAGRWEIEALDGWPANKVVYARFSGPNDALGPITEELLRRRPGRLLDADEAAGLWKAAEEFEWAHADGALIKLAITPADLETVAQLAGLQPDTRVWIGAGGASAMVSLAHEAHWGPLATRVGALGWPALTVRGEAPLMPGHRERSEIRPAVKHALDPNHRFPSLES